MARCVNCNEEVYFEEAENAEKQGHIYSLLGRKEFSITQLCEFCFDEITNAFEESEHTAMSMPLVREDPTLRETDGLVEFFNSPLTEELRVGTNPMYQIIQEQDADIYGHSGCALFVCAPRPDLPFIYQWGPVEGMEGTQHYVFNFDDPAETRRVFSELASRAAKYYDVDYRAYNGG